MLPLGYTDWNFVGTHEEADSNICSVVYYLCSVHVVHAWHKCSVSSDDNTKICSEILVQTGKAVALNISSL